MTEKIQKRLENFLYYHKGSITAGCLVIALLLYGCFQYMSDGPEPVIYGEIINQEVQEEVVQSVCSHALSMMGKDPGRERILLGTGLVIDTEDPEKNASSGVLEKMTSQIFSHELDFLIAPRNVMDYYAELGGLYDLDELKNENEDEWEIHTIKSRNKEGEKKNYGVDISGTALASDHKDIVFCVLKNSEHKEETMIFLESLFE